VQKVSGRATNDEKIGRTSVVFECIRGFETHCSNVLTIVGQCINLSLEQLQCECKAMQIHVTEASHSDLMSTTHPSLRLINEG
jgi:hypothetical protein